MLRLGAFPCVLARIEILEQRGPHFAILEERGGVTRGVGEALLGQFRCAVGRDPPYAAAEEVVVQLLALLVGECNRHAHALPLDEDHLAELLGRFERE